MVLSVASVWDISRFDLPGVEAIGIDRSETDAIVIAFLLIIPAFLADRATTSQRMRETQLLDERLRVLRVTMRTVQDIVNNSLNQLQLLRLEAEGHVSDDTLTLFDRTIQDTALQLTALGNLTIFVEKPMGTGPGVDVNPPEVPRPPTT